MVVDADRYGEPRPRKPLFDLPIRVYWEDTDAGGVVYHASYLRFLERARSEWLRSQGVDQWRLRAEHGVLFVIHELRVRFRAPARLDDELRATIDAFTRRSASITFAQCILRVPDGATLIEADVRTACVDAASLRPRRIPESLLAEYSQP
jgi:acyl-CoA thioester hydrolase